MTRTLDRGWKRWFVTGVRHTRQARRGGSGRIGGDRMRFPIGGGGLDGRRRVGHGVVRWNLSLSLSLSFVLSVLYSFTSTALPMQTTVVPRKVLLNARTYDSKTDGRMRPRSTFRCSVIRTNLSLSRGRETTQPKILLV